MIQDIMDFLSQADPEVGASIQKEFDREQHNIELIASENIVSKAVLLAMGTCLTNKYAEGYPGKRYYGGCYAVDVTEELARQRACQLFDCAHANVQPHSGANANLAAFFALLQPGDTVLSMNLAHGGHLSHGSPVNISGKYFRIVPYGVSDDTETIDYEQVMAIAKECRPKLILAGASAYPRTLDFAKFREIADAVGARLMVDMAHIAGLVAAGVHPSPIPYADGAYHRRQGRVLGRGAEAGVPGLWAAGGCQRRGSGGKADRAGLPAGLRRHGQPSDSGGHPALWPHRQGV